MIRSIIKYLLHLIMGVVKYSTLNFVKDKMNVVHTIWLSNSLSHVGEKTLIKRGTVLESGCGKGIYIGNCTGVGYGAILRVWKRYQGREYSPEIIIGDHCSLGDYIHISAINSIKIGNGVMTGRFVTIVDNNHYNSKYGSFDLPPAERELSSKGGIIIEDNVWISDKVTILSGVKIGKGAIVAANSVVTKNIPEYCIAAGLPCKVIRERYINDSL